MNRLKEHIKYALSRCLDLVVWTLILGLSASWLFVNGIFVTNVVNAFRYTGYIGPIIGIQIVLLIVGIVWIPLLAYAGVRSRLDG